jgi:hypothetical protein
VFGCNVLMSAYKISSSAGLFDLINHLSSRGFLVLYSPGVLSYG